MNFSTTYFISPNTSKRLSFVMWSTETFINEVFSTYPLLCLQNPVCTSHSASPGSTATWAGGCQVDPVVSAPEPFVSELPEESGIGIRQPNVGMSVSSEGHPSVRGLSSSHSGQVVLLGQPRTVPTPLALATSLATARDLSCSIRVLSCDFKN